MRGAHASRVQRQSGSDFGRLAEILELKFAIARRHRQQARARALPEKNPDAGFRTISTAMRLARPTELERRFLLQVLRSQPEKH